MRQASILALVLALAACGSESKPEQRTALSVVGSSTVYPFALAVADGLAKADPNLAKPTVKSTGTGEGIKEFCASSTADAPDIVNASRRMTKAEFDECKSHGVTDIVEIQVGLDGIVFANAKDKGAEFPLTPATIYRALAAKPFGKDQSAQNWSDIDGALPARPIIVYGPPRTSGTRDALIELALNRGCETQGGNRALKSSDPAKYLDLCSTLRGSPVYLDQEEDDEAVVRKVAANPDALAVFGYSYAADNPTRVKALPISGVEPSATTIADGTYPLSRPLFIYVNKAHTARIPGIRPYLDQWVKNWGPDGSLARIGLVPSHEADLAKNAQLASQLTAMTGEGLE